MVKAHWNLYFDCRRCFWDWHDDTNAAHVHSKCLHIWFHFVVVLINIPVIHMTCRWLTGTISAGAVIPNACFRWKTNGTPATAEVNNRETASQKSERSRLFSDNHLVEAPVPAVGQSTLPQKSLQTCRLCSWCSGFCEGVEHQYFWSGDSLIIGSVYWIWSNLSDQSGYGEVVALASVLSKSAEPT